MPQGPSRALVKSAAGGDALAAWLQTAESVLGFFPRMTLSPQRSSACRLLVLLAASYVTFASNVAGHALLGATYGGADEGAPSSRFELGGS